ncbi:hypothetical protein [Hirschia baltica]|uniref:Excinuclease ATPase subunit n=1 Tax=Hirschia baltica (strain ATCC 49814 / DSM 5838 / IFAM 1418) TaxID=582402 RepID=C6XIQ1_HIRBI|nr:hypothetical protein [Hirschia baltica]ACT58996.1 hypothetical protein Hbal_1304 [Hirschia baltica ATCC 49814]
MSIKSLVLATSAVVLFSGVPTAQAASKPYVFSVADFMAKEENKSALDGFQFVWGKSASGSQIGDVSTGGRPANGFHKDIQASCERALLNSLIAMKDLAISKGASKVTGIHSSQGTDFNPATEYVCYKNKFVAKTPLNGTASN